MNWKAIKRFNFTWALSGGAWLEDDKGAVNWFTFETIRAQLGQAWIDAQISAQGWTTGCWIDCVPVYPREIARGVVETKPGVFRCNV